jgi:hypothetical protein
MAYKSSLVPNYETIKKTNSKYFSLNNVYKAHYKLIDVNNIDSNNNSNILIGSDGYGWEDNYILIEGNDHDCKLLKNVFVSLPFLYMDGYKVMTEAEVKKIEVSINKGVANVKVRNNNVVYIDEHVPIELIESINNYFKSYKSGFLRNQLYFWKCYG